MMTKTIQAIAATAIAVAVLTIHDKPAGAQGPAACNNQPNMASALNHLMNAKGWLARAEHDKGGWRGRAIETTNTAIRETERGCAFADTH
jgi:hypothetical protein